jgi:hypothetical protein
VQTVSSLDELHALYGAPAASSLLKVAPRLAPQYRRWIEASRFCILSTVGPEGTDASPRGDNGPVVGILDETTLALPDWHGNNRIDSLRNIVRDSRASLMFLVPGSNNVVRVNGTARVSADETLCGRFAREGRAPRSVIVIAVGEVYFQCARALIRSALWTSGDLSAGLPSAGEMLAEASRGAEGGADYDAAWPARAAKTMW